MIYKLSKGAGATFNLNRGKLNIVVREFPLNKSKEQTRFKQHRNIHRLVPVGTRGAHVTTRHDHVGLCHYSDWRGWSRGH